MSARTLFIVLSVSLMSCGGGKKESSKEAPKGGTEAPPKVDTKTPNTANKVAVDHLALWKGLKAGDAKVLPILKGVSSKDRLAIWEGGMNVLHAAAQGGNLELVKEAMSSELIGQEDSEGWTPLHHACAKGKLKAAAFLIEKGADVKAITKRRRTTYHLAVKSGNLALMKLINDKGVNIALKDRYNLGVADFAVMSGKMEVYKKLGEPQGERNTLKKNLLHHAAEAGSYELFVHLHKKGIRLNHRDRRKRTSTHVAARNGNAKLLKYILENNGRIWEGDDQKRVPLHYAAWSGMVDAAKLLTEKKIWLEKRDRSGKYPLHYAAMSGKVEMVKFLIEQGAKPHMPDYEKRYPIHYAADGGHTHIIELLAAKGADVNQKDKQGRTPLHWAADMGMVKAMKLLVAKGAKVAAKDHYDRTAMHHALGSPRSFGSKKGKKSQNARYPYSTPVTTKGAQTTDAPLLQEIRIDRAVALLISKGVSLESVDGRGNTPFSTVLSKGFVKIASRFLAAGADPLKMNKKSGLTGLHYAAASGSSELVTMILKKMKSGGISTAAKDGKTPLHIAAMVDSVAVIELLLGKGADVNAKDGGGNTPLHVAGPKAGLLLSQKGAKGDAANAEGATPLHQAAIAGAKELVEKLGISKEAVSVKDKNGVTPLHLAIWRGHAEVAALLIKKGADLKALDNEGTAAYMTLGDGYAPAEAAVTLLDMFKKAQISCEESDKKGNSLSHYFAGAQNVDEAIITRVAKLCTSAGENKEGDTPLHLAARANNAVFIKGVLGEMTADEEERNNPGGRLPAWSTAKNKAGYTPLQEAVRLDKADALLAMVRGGGYCRDMKLKGGKECMHTFASKGILLAVKLFKDEAGITFVKDEKGWTPSHYAAAHNQSAFLATYYANNRDAIKGAYGIDAKDNKGRTPFHIAALKGRLSAARWFMVKKAGLTTKDTEGNTLMHFAVMSGKMFMVKFMKKHKVPHNIKNNAGKLPADLTKLNRIKRILK